MFLYTSANDNKLAVLEIEDTSGSFVRNVQTIDAVVDPLPEGTVTTGSRKHVTEWIVTHPKFRLLYAFTSFWSQHPACVTTYRISPTTGKLTKLGVVETKGLHAVHATVSPDASSLVVAHRNDGKLTFFDCSRDEALDEAVKVIDTPEVRPETRTTKMPYCLPSLYQVCYSPNGKYLMTTDWSAQSRIWTYTVDERGMITSDNPIYKQKMKAIGSPPGQVGNFMSWMLDSPYRVRRVAFHPSGRYVYILYESHLVVQVYEVKQDGKIIPDCLQEVPCVDAEFHSKSWKGLALTEPAEMVASADGIWVSNRGMVVGPMGKAESSVRFLRFEQGGSRLAPSTCLEVAGPVRHFLIHNGMILSGVNAEDPGVVETFQSQDGSSYRKTGEAPAGMNVVCIAVQDPVPGA